MSKVWKTLRWLLLAIVLVVGYAGYRIGVGTPFTLNQLANRQTLLFLYDNPELLTSVGIADGTVFDYHSGRLSPVGVEKRDADYATFERFAAEVRKFDRSRLSREEQVTYDILLDQWQTQLAFRRFDWLSSEGLYPISPMWGTQVTELNFLLSQHVIKNEKTARNYVKRLEALSDKLDGVTAEMQRQAKAGVILPIALLEKAEAGIRDTVSPSPAANPLVATFVERMQKAKIEPGLASELAKGATETLVTRVYPAYARMTAALEAVRPASEKQTAGVDRLPDGAAYYRAMLRQMTTTDYTPDQIHELGLREVARITDEMDTLLKAQGLTAGTVGERMQALGKDPKFQYPNTDEGRQQVLGRYQAILDEVNAKMPQYFRVLPPQKLIVARVPLAAEKGAADAYYEAAAMDGSRPGTFFANLRDTREQPTFGMKTLAYHEGIPGHHFQISVAQNIEGVPLIRQQTLYSAYAEGWALYAERFAAEIGMYKDDPFGDLGRLQAELFRAVRLVDDTGLHSKGWTREQAIDYMVKTTGMNEAEVTSEVERYMGLPGQACAYKVGQLKILELRDRAKAALGSKFDIRGFHAAVLEHGRVPLTLLDKLVDEWIASEKAKG